MTLTPARWHAAPHVLLRMGEGIAIAEVTPPAWESGGSYSAASDRMTLSALLTPGPAPGPFAPWGGCKPATLDTGMAVTALGTPAMFVQVNTGTCFVPAGIASNSGWVCHNNGQRQCVIGASNASNPRIDVVVAHVYDAVDDSGVLNSWALEVVPGTPASSPVAPAVPSNAIILAQVAVPAASTSVTAGNVTDLRTWEVGLGGVLPVNSLAQVPAGYAGHYVHDRASGRLAHNLAAGPAQPKLLPAAPVVAATGSQVNEGGTGEVTVLTASFTATGNEDWEIYFKAGGVQATQSGAPQFSVLFRTYIDSSQIDGFFTASQPADGNNHAGVAFTTYAAAAVMATRPTAGAHVAKVTFQTQTVFGASVIATTINPIVLRAKPVCL